MVTPDSIRDLIAADEVLQKAFEKIFKAHRPVFDAMYGVKDGTKRTHSEVATLLDMKEVDVHEFASKAVARIQSPVFQRLFAVLSGEAVVPFQSIADKRRRNYEVWTAINQKVYEDPQYRVNEEEARYLWEKLTPISQHVLYLQHVEGLNQAAIATRRGVSDTAVSGQIRKINRDMRTNPAITFAAMKEFGVMEDPTVEKETA